jgi:hypothetical protein
MELDDATWPGDDNWPGDDAVDEPDPDWPGDWPEDDPPGGDREGPLWPVPPAPPRGWDSRPGRRGPRPLALALVAIVALLAGGAALAVTRGLAGQPPAAAPGSGTGGSATLPGSSGGGATGQAFVAGQVQKLSSTSITIGGGAQSMTAAVTSATKVTGKVTSIGAVKVGDDVSAQITVSSSGQATVTAIQDPAQAPSSGSLP